jgi:hypothetical protein
MKAWLTVSEGADYAAVSRDKILFTYSSAVAMRARFGAR